jgi:hypothetical protein
VNSPNLVLHRGSTGLTPFLQWVIVQGIAFGYVAHKSSQKYLKFSDQAIWLSLSVG